MNIDKEIQQDCQAKLTVSFEKDEFEGYKRRGAKKISKNTKIPGFRPGKAPYQVIVNHYGESAIVQEAIDLLLEEEYSKILDEAGVTPSGAGNLDSVESYDPPVFVFSVPLEPEIDLGNYREIRKEYQPEAFDDEEVEEYITNLRRNSATIIPADHPAEPGNLVYFNLSGEFLNPEEGEDPIITDKTPQQVVIPESDEVSESEWPFSGFAQQLRGIKAGDIKEIQHQYPDEVEDEDYRGKTAMFTVQVQSVKELELPELDEDFVQSQGDFETVQDYRNALEERLREQHQETYDQEYFNDLLHEITEQAEINYPPQMLDQEIDNVLEDIKSRLQRQNLDYETYLKLRNVEEEKFIEDEVRPTAINRLKRSLVSNALVEEENLKIDQEMLKGRIGDVMNEVIYSGNADEMQKQMGKEAFSRAISMEGVSRTINAQLQERLKLIATGQPVPDEEAVDDADDQPADEGTNVMDDQDSQEMPKSEPVDTEPDMLDENNNEDKFEEVSESLESQKDDDHENKDAD